MATRVIDQAEEIIAKYLEAYRAANQKEPDYAFVYERGWFIFRYELYDSRERKARIVEMTATLNARAQA